MHRAVTALLAATSLAGLLGACAADTPEVPLGPDGEPDAVLLVGRDVYSDRCATCHGSGGGGGRGPKISEGSTFEDYPHLSDQVDFVKAGKGAMPGFDDALSDDELVAVVRYVREVL